MENSFIIQEGTDLKGNQFTGIRKLLKSHSFHHIWDSSEIAPADSVGEACRSEYGFATLDELVF